MPRSQRSNGIATMARLADVVQVTKQAVKTLEVLTQNEGIFGMQVAYDAMTKEPTDEMKHLAELKGGMAIDALDQLTDGGVLPTATKTWRRDSKKELAKLSLADTWRWLLAVVHDGLDPESDALPYEIPTKGETLVTILNFIDHCVDRMEPAAFGKGRGAALAARVRKTVSLVADAELQNRLKLSIQYTPFKRERPGKPREQPAWTMATAKEHLDALRALARQLDSPADDVTGKTKLASREPPKHGGMARTPPTDTATRRADEHSGLAGSKRRQGPIDPTKSKVIMDYRRQHGITGDPKGGGHCWFCDEHGHGLFRHTKADPTLMKRWEAEQGRPGQRNKRVRFVNALAKEGQRGSGALTVPAQIEGPIGAQTGTDKPTATEVLLDTGAEISVIGESLAKKAQLPIDSPTCPTITAIATGGTVTVIGTTTVRARIGTQVVELREVHVLPDSTACRLPLVIGNPDLWQEGQELEARMRDGELQARMGRTGWWVQVGNTCRGVNAIKAGSQPEDDETETQERTNANARVDGEQAAQTNEQQPARAANSNAKATIDVQGAYWQVGADERTRDAGNEADSDPTANEGAAAITINNTTIHPDDMRPDDLVTLGTPDPMKTGLEDIRVASWVPKDKREWLLQKLQPYKEQFGHGKKALDPVELPALPTNLVEMKIELTPGTDPADIVDSHRYYSTEQRQALAENCEKFQAQGVVDTKASSSASRTYPVMTKKKDETWRTNGDSRKLNTRTVPDRYITPNIREIIAWAAKYGATSVIDGFQAFWQVALHPDSRPLVAMYFGEHRFYEWRRAVMGLRNTPAVFQRFVDEHIDPRNGHYRSYIDDQVIGLCPVVEIDGRTRQADGTPNGWSIERAWEERIEPVLKRAKEAGYLLSAPKTILIASVQTVLGTLVGPGWHAPPPSRLQALEEMPAPRTRKQISQFTGAIRFYDGYLPGLTTLLRPLDQEKAKRGPFNWGPEQQQAFEQAKSTLARAVALEAPPPNAEFRVDTDYSSVTNTGGYVVHFRDPEKLKRGATIKVAKPEPGTSEGWRPYLFGAVRFADTATPMHAVTGELRIIYEALRRVPELNGKRVTIGTDSRINWDRLNGANLAQGTNANEHRWVIEIRAKAGRIEHVTTPVADFISRNDQAAEEMDQRRRAEGVDTVALSRREKERQGAPPAIAAIRAQRDAEDGARGDDQEANCPECDRPNEDEDMVQCSDCEQWYHMTCAGYERDQGEADELFACQNCSEKTSCTMCSRPDSEDDMVQCDRCEEWQHVSCTAHAKNKPNGEHVCDQCQDATVADDHRTGHCDDGWDDCDRCAADPGTTGQSANGAQPELSGGPGPGDSNNDARAEQQRAREVRLAGHLMTETGYKERWVQDSKDDDALAEIRTAAANSGTIGGMAPFWDQESGLLMVTPAQATPIKKRAREQGHDGNGQAATSTARQAEGGANAKSKAQWYIVVPPQYRREIVSHYRGAAGHKQGATIALIAQRYWWPGYASDIREWGAKCESCAMVRATRKRQGMGPDKREDLQRNERLGIDVVTLGDQKFLSVTDGATTYMWLSPIASRKEEELLRAYREIVAPHHGSAPAYVTADLEMANKAFKGFLAGMGTTFQPTPAHGPDARSFYERAHKDLRNAFTRRRLQVGPGPTDAELAQYALAETNGAPGANGAPSAYRRYYGTDLRTPMNAKLRATLAQEIVPEDEQDAADQILQAVAEAGEAELTERKAKRARNEKDRAKRLAAEPTFRAGDRVRMWTPVKEGKAHIYTTGLTYEGESANGRTVTLRSVTGQTLQGIARARVAHDEGPMPIAMVNGSDNTPNSGQTTQWRVGGELLSAKTHDLFGLLPQATKSRNETRMRNLAAKVADEANHAASRPIPDDPDALETEIGKIDSQIMTQQARQAKNAVTAERARQDVERPDRTLTTAERNRILMRGKRSEERAEDNQRNIKRLQQRLATAKRKLGEAEQAGHEGPDDDCSGAEANGPTRRRSKRPRRYQYQEPYPADQ